MDFEDLFEKKKRHYKKQDWQPEYSDNRYRQKSYNSGYAGFNPTALLSALQNNKKLKIVFFVVAIIVIAVIIGLIAVFFPLIKAIVQYVSQNGISGLLDMIIDFLNKLWHGTK